MSDEKANGRQVGGTHYKGKEIQHWDYAWIRNFDLFQYIITKWVERWRDKGGIEDLRKARHALDKYIECVKEEESKRQGLRQGLKAGVSNPGEGPGPEYVDQ